jgi:hypothetical protein
MAAAQKFSLDFDLTAISGELLKLGVLNFGWMEEHHKYTYLIITICYHTKY